MDYLKYDFCHMQNATQPVRYYYEKMRDALNATGRPIHFNICSWGAGDPHLWGRHVGNSWRTGNDIGSDYHRIFANLVANNLWAGRLRSAQAALCKCRAGASIELGRTLKVTETEAT